MKFKLPKRQTNEITYTNTEGEVVKVSSKERKHLIKSLSKSVSYPDNELYLYVTEYLKKVAQENQKYFKVQTAHSIMNLDYMSYESTATTLLFGCGLINIHSRAKSLDITRVVVHKGNHNKGYGTFMMQILMSAIVVYTLKTKKFPKVILECSGSVGAGDKFQQTPVHQQVKFFEKFGFQLERVKDGYHHMILTLKGLEQFVKKNSSFLQSFVEAEF